MTELLYNVHDIFDAVGRSGCLQQHGCRAFRIPPYQRGYKWGSEENQPVETLLRDLRQAWKGKAKEYLLQAITVKKIANAQDGAVLEVIDGQQRLTTLFILVHALKHHLTGSVRSNIAENRLRYSIRHEKQSLDAMVTAWIAQVEKPAANFNQLKSAQNVDHQKHQDCYYLQCAVLRCLHALGDASPRSSFQSKEHLEDFQKFLLHEVKLMVNAVEPHISGEEIFGNLNANRILLTETELIKGLLLTKVAREPSAGRPRRYREVLEMRIQLGRKWDELNHWANLPEIQSLYFPDFESAGMQGLLELVARRMPKPFVPPVNADGKQLFEYFFRQRNFEPVFHLLADTCARIQDWHEHTATYHLLGFCLVHLDKPGDRMRYLVELLKHETKSALKKALHSRRATILGSNLGGTEDGSGLDLNKLGFGGDGSQIQSILLALSVFQVETTARFNFFAYEAEKWSLEHIFPQSPFGKGAILNESQKSAFDQIIGNSAGILSQKTVEQMTHLQPVDEADRVEIERLLQSEPLLHRIGNLCLLALQDNASLQCAMFDDKRRHIRKRIAQGSFVPRHTYEVFSKMIAGEDESLDVWSKRDIEAHEAEISRRIGALMKEKA